MWTEAYANACSEYDVGVRNAIAEMEGGCLSVPGCTFERFKDRVRDEEVAAIGLAGTSCPVLSEVLLPWNVITSVGAAHLADALRNGLNTVIAIDLSYNSIESEGAIALAEALADGVPVCYLRLAGNPLGGGCGPAMWNMMGRSQSLVELDLYATHLDMKSLVHITHALTVNTSLLSLNIGKPHLICPDDINYVVHHLDLGLRGNTTLCKLGLSHFGIRDEHLRALLPSLCVNGITHLSLKGNQLSQEAGGMLARLLDRRDDLVELDLSANRLRDVGGCALAQGVRTHASLQSLRMENCTMGEAALVALATAVGDCRPLEHLALWGNDFSGEAIPSMYAIRDRLERLKTVDFRLYMLDGQPSMYRE